MITDHGIKEIIKSEVRKVDVKRLQINQKPTETEEKEQLRRY